MNRFLLLAAFFALLISSEVAISVLAVNIFDICLLEKGMDVEGEKDSKDKSEKDDKVEILLGSMSDSKKLLLSSLSFSEKAISSNPYFELVTPPPEV